MTFRARYVGISISCPAKEVYEYVSNPENLPNWATGLSGSIAHIDGDWIAGSPFGRVRIKFADKNEFGVLDHNVTLLDSGETFYNPMRVYPNGDGSEVVFTAYQRGDMSDQAFDEDAQSVLKDLQRVKSLLEK